MKLGVRCLTALIVAAGLAATGQAQTVTPVAQLDLTRFLGQWYQIARLPDKAEKKCSANVFTLYAASDKKLRFSDVRSCMVRPGDNDIANEDGRQDKTGDGKLSVKHLVIFHQKRWVLAIAPDYTWALMGDPKHKTLWLLSRSATMDDAVLADLKSRAGAQGFDVSKLLMVKQEVRIPGGRVLSAAPQ